MEKRVCGFSWSTRDGMLGSNHTCSEEHGHDTDVHVCHCEARTPFPLTAGDAIEIAEQLHIALGEFAVGLKALRFMSDGEARASMRAELVAAASMMRDTTFDFLSRVIAHGAG